MNEISSIEFKNLACCTKHDRAIYFQGETHEQCPICFSERRRYRYRKDLLQAVKDYGQQTALLGVHRAEEKQGNAAEWLSAMQRVSQLADRIHGNVGAVLQHLAMAVDGEKEKEKEKEKEGNDGKG